jgi:protein-tyrosine phosphatase
MTSHVLFVCTGNICRSPFAEYYARDLWREHDIETSSAGTYPVTGHGATDTMIRVGNARGLNLTPHRSQGLGSAGHPDLILCMEQHHVDAATRAFTDLPATSIRLLTAEGVDDPYGRSMDHYERAAAEIISAVISIGIPGGK